MSEASKISRGEKDSGGKPSEYVPREYKGSANLWGELEPVVAACGLELFDLDIPSGRRGLLRVLIARPIAAKKTVVTDSLDTQGAGEPQESGLREGGVTVDDCARVSRAIVDLPHVDEFIPDGWTIEVSSPGVNRRLQRPKHFEGAVGEHVKITAAKMARADGAGAVGGREALVCVTGVLASFVDSTLVFEAGECNSVPFTERLIIALQDVRNAHVDFRFE